MTVQDLWTHDHHAVLADDVPEGDFLVDDEPVSVEGDHVLHLLLLAGVLTNEADLHREDGRLHGTGDPTEVALLLSALTAGIEPQDARAAFPQVAEIPFEPAARYTATVRDRRGTHNVFVKGAPERVLEMCGEIHTAAGPVPIDRSVVQEAASEMAARGRRVLALAYRELPDPLSPLADLQEPDRLVFLGLQGMIDPPRPGVGDAIAATQAAGIRVVMIIGDHVDTARAVAERLGILRSGDESHRHG
ncbi:MAG: hypothetical protein ACFCVK_16365 [Acidimicrobiales bacterium]